MRSTQHHKYLVTAHYKSSDDAEPTREIAQLDKSDEDELYLRIGDETYYFSWSQVRNLLKELETQGE